MLLELENTQKYIGTTDFYKTIKIETEVKSLFLYGPSGSGKTFKTHQLARKVLEKTNNRWDVRFVTFKEIIETNLKLLNMKLDLSERANLKMDLRDYKECDLLIIDELGIEKFTENRDGNFFDIIKFRDAHRKPYYLTSNFSLEELKDKFSDRTLRRIQDNCYVRFCDERIYFNQNPENSKLIAKLG